MATPSRPPPLPADDGRGQEAERPAPPPLRLVPPEAGDDRVFRWAIAVSLAAHATLLLWLAWLEHQVPDREPPAPAPVVMRFVPAPPPTEVVPPPDTENVSEHDSRARSPEPRPDLPPDSEPSATGLVPEPTRPAPATPPPQPRPPTPREEERPLEPRPAPDGATKPKPTPPTPEEQQQRFQEALAEHLRPRPLGDLNDEPLPMLPGGYAPEGDLQFESRADVDWGPYAARLRRIVKGNWRIPTAAQVGMDGVVQVHFFIRRDGGVDELEVVRESGTIPLDVAARDAIALSDKLPPPPLPADSPEERVGVTWTFFYNIDDREYRAWRREERLRARRAAYGDGDGR